MGSDADEAEETASPFFPMAGDLPLASKAGSDTGVAELVSLAARVSAIGGLTRSQLASASRAELQVTLERLLAALKNVPQTELQLGERHGDGSLQITSHLAVWLIGKVADGYGAKLVRLSKVSDREVLRSVGGLAGLLSGSIAMNGRK